LQGDEKLIAMARGGNTGAFETIVDRYQGRLQGFCRQMLGSTEDAEDVLQEVFVNAYRAMLADEREINLRPWLYRIARNRCLNHLRKPTADAQESMDMVPAVEASSTAERVHNREEFRQILGDVNKLPETQRSALLLREMDALSYEEIATAMDTTVPSIKSLLVRARISLAEASQARLLTCAEVRIELSEAAEGMRKVTAPARRHIRECEECADFRSQVRSNEKALAALFPVAPLIALKGFIAAKLGFGGSAAGAGAASAGSVGAGAAGAGAVGGVGAAIGGTAGGLGGLGATLGGALGTKAVAGVVTAAVLTAGAVEVKEFSRTPANQGATAVVSKEQSSVSPALTAAPHAAKPAIETNHAATVSTPVAEEPELPPSAPVATTEEAPFVPASTADDATAQALDPEAAGEGIATAEPSTGTGAQPGGPTIVVVTTPPPSPTPAQPSAPQPPDPAPVFVPNPNPVTESPPLIPVEPPPIASESPVIVP
jgi:RNA polymerase sigma factor (sigma-70 family)